MIQELLGDILHFLVSQVLFGLVIIGIKVEHVHLGLFLEMKIVIIMLLSDNGKNSERILNA
jgi:hypothetical protein